MSHDKVSHDLNCYVVAVTRKKGFDLFLHTLHGWSLAGIGH